MVFESGLCKDEVGEWAAVPGGRGVRPSPGAWCRPNARRQPGCGRSRRCRVSRRGRLGDRRPIRARPPAPTKRPVLALGRARCVCLWVGGWVGGWVSEVGWGVECGLSVAAVRARLRCKRHVHSSAAHALMGTPPFQHAPLSLHFDRPGRCETRPRAQLVLCAAAAFGRDRFHARPLPPPNACP